MIFPASEDRSESLGENHQPNVQLFGSGVYPRLGKLNGNYWSKSFPQNVRFFTQIELERESWLGVIVL